MNFPLNLLYFMYPLIPLEYIIFKNQKINFLSKILLNGILERLLHCPKIPLIHPPYITSPTSNMRPPTTPKY